MRQTTRSAFTLALSQALNFPVLYGPSGVLVRALMAFAKLFMYGDNVGLVVNALLLSF